MFDEIDHTAVMDRVRLRIKDKRMCALVKAFLKAGVLTDLGDREESLTGTPQGGILSPLLANIALSALDEHFARQWNTEMGSDYQRRGAAATAWGTGGLSGTPTISCCWCPVTATTPKRCANRCRP